MKQVASTNNRQLKEEFFKRVRLTFSPRFTVRPYFKRVNDLDDITPALLTQKRCHVLYTADGKHFMAVYHGWPGMLVKSREDALDELYKLADQFARMEGLTGRYYEGGQN